MRQKLRWGKRPVPMRPKATFVSSGSERPEGQIVKHVSHDLVYIADITELGDHSSKSMKRERKTIRDTEDWRMNVLKDWRQEPIGDQEIWVTFGSRVKRAYRSSSRPASGMLVARQHINEWEDRTGTTSAQGKDYGDEEVYFRIALQANQ
ncbi:hypothetical protein FDENT_5372 [Fusarium denticulatum]|uniref:Uncharacterized protein n=1 Tax=Fusarium denticulatum TaxID=48507 RepID=A0A8H5X964_9HYPO|nr:hypothetical protein FDENT_5372 [Fusarium denticulatum]